MGNSQSSTLSSAKTVLAALRILCESTEAVSLAAMTNALDVSEATAYRVLRTLVDAGYARGSLGRHGYEPTLEVVRLGGLVMHRDILLETCRSYFETVARRFQEAIVVGVPDGPRILFVEKYMGPRNVDFFCDVGKHLPLHVGAAARCILAHTSNDYFDRYLGCLGGDNTQTEKLREELRIDRCEIRSRGYAISDGEVDAGISAVAVPILNSSAQVLTVASIANLTARWQQADRTSRATEMCAAARSVMTIVADLPSRFYTHGVPEHEHENID